MLAVAALLVFSAFRAGAVAADTVTSPTGTVNSSDGLNLRSGPGQSYDVLAVMPNGATVIITGNPTSDNWLPVQYNGQIGWADGVYVTLNSPTPPQAGGNGSPGVAAAAPPAPPAPPGAPSAASAASGGTATVLPPDGLNLRSGPDTSYGVLSVIPGGASVTITGAPNNQWYPVSVNGQSGWVDGAFLSNNGGAALVTANAVSSTAGASVSTSAGSGATHDGGTATPSPSPTTAPAAASPPGKLAWPTNSRRISTVFSPSHLGVDIDEFPAGGNPVGASAPGTVTFAGGDACCSYGLHVIVDHGNGMETLYAHMSSLAVKVGDVVKQGQKLGISGCTGRCTGPHVHFEVHVNGKPVDPLQYLPPPWTIE
ncbi:MAG TPA: SH3 domain-containing protein [Dehalococcoidia bacterium]|nr:SH3 domain-containing protein [Dehalococcoidia bacterium]